MKTLLSVGMVLLCLLLSSKLTYAHTGVTVPIIERMEGLVVADIPIPDSLVDAAGQLTPIRINIYDMEGNVVYATTITTIAAIELPTGLPIGTYSLQANYQNWNYSVELRIKNIDT